MHDLATIVAINKEPEKYRKSQYELKADLAEESLVEEHAKKARTFDFQAGSDTRVHNHNVAPKPKADLYAWQIMQHGLGMVAYGIIKNDEAKRFHDGDEVRTSSIVKVDVLTMTIETMNTIYNLKYLA